MAKKQSEAVQAMTGRDFVSQCVCWGRGSTTTRLRGALQVVSEGGYPEAAQQALALAWAASIDDLLDAACRAQSQEGVTYIHEQAYPPSIRTYRTQAHRHTRARESETEREREERRRRGCRRKHWVWQSHVTLRRRQAKAMGTATWDGPGLTLTGHYPNGFLRTQAQPYTKTLRDTRRLASHPYPSRTALLRASLIQNTRRLVGDHFQLAMAEPKGEESIFFFFSFVQHSVCGCQAPETPIGCHPQREQKKAWRGGKKQTNKTQSVWGIQLEPPPPQSLSN
ncbi:hypothetical protein LZ30DRAFT_177687 [Colletotrichum cereale]|nr:hypothetical protein LZ30DRAFT_177687 [Colletotrichum cereale]